MFHRNTQTQTQTRACTHTNARAHEHTHTHARAHTHLRARTYICAGEHRSVNDEDCTHKNTHIMYICACACGSACVRTCGVGVGVGVGEVNKIYVRALAIRKCGRTYPLGTRRNNMTSSCRIFLKCLQKVISYIDIALWCKYEVICIV